MSNIKKEKHLEFSKSIIEGVEIKRCRNTPHAYKPHVHNELSLGYIVEGSTDLSLNENVVHYCLGDGVIIPPLMTHRCAPRDLDHWAYIMLYIDPAYYEKDVCFARAKKLTGKKAEKLVSFIDRLVVEQTPNLPENILIELLLEFGDPVERGRSELTKEAESAIGNIKDIVEAIHDYILDNIGREVSLENLQEVFGINKFTIIRNFKKQYSTTPASYHLQCRVAEAKNLLNNGKDVFEICEILRFYDQAHFIKEFKKMFGITPHAYMTQLKR